MAEGAAQVRERRVGSVEGLDIERLLAETRLDVGGREENRFSSKQLARAGVRIQGHGHGPTFQRILL